VQLLMAELGLRDWLSPVWDACAGRGGKTTALLESVEGPVWASDISRDKVKGLRSELLRLFLPSAPAFVHDAAGPHCLKRFPGTLLLDVPCSGLGVLSRRPDIKHKRNPKELERLSRIQLNILRHCLEGVPPGGQVFYVTCTLNPGENELLIQEHLFGEGRGLRLERSFSPVFSGMNEFFYAAHLSRPKAG
jgi:16S rRNA (cytosine967-C5)-methyltransferase